MLAAHTPRRVATATIAIAGLSLTFAADADVGGHRAVRRIGAVG
jgi:hypothetical protein